MVDYFEFRGHFVIVFELLHQNLLAYQRRVLKEKRMGVEEIRKVAKQVVNGLNFLSRLSIIHCDLKPENIMFTDQRNQQVKIVDFGSACTDYKTGFKYVQSRFYRCPEIILGLPYS